LRPAPAAPTRFHYPYFRPGFLVRSGSRAFARISSRTLGRYVAVTNPAPPRCRSNGFQRISVALHPPPEEPRQRNGPLGAPKRRPAPPQPAPHPPRLVCGGNHGAGTHWCPSGGLLSGGAPTAGALNRVRIPRADPSPPPFGQAALGIRLCLPSYEKLKKDLSQIQFEPDWAASLNTWPPLWSPLVA
jgi:hypothetical protein